VVCCLFKRVGEADELRLTELTSKEFDPHWQPLFRESYGDDNARESRTWTQSCDLPTQLFLPNLCRGPQNGGMDQCVEVMLRQRHLYALACKTVYYRNRLQVPGIIQRFRLYALP